MVRIERREFEQVEPFIDSIFREQALEHFEEIREKIEETEETITLVAYIEEELAGSLVAQRKYDHLYIQYLTVSTAFQGQNIGTQLMETAENLAREISIVNITLKTRHYQAADFYHKCGYKCYATLEDMPMRGVAMHYFVKRIV